MQFKEKFVAFVDILGFQELVKSAEAGTGLTLAEILELVSKLGSPDEQERFAKHGPTTCPFSKYLQPDLDFKITQISDCVIVSAEVSPAGLINLVSHCWG